MKTRRCAHGRRWDPHRHEHRGARHGREEILQQRDAGAVISSREAIEHAREQQHGSFHENESARDRE
jgi:hypothetical protein